MKTIYYLTPGFRVIYKKINTIKVLDLESGKFIRHEWRDMRYIGNTKQIYLPLTSLKQAYKLAILLNKA